MCEVPRRFSHFKGRSLGWVFRSLKHPREVSVSCVKNDVMINLMQIQHWRDIDFNKLKYYSLSNRKDICK